MLVMYRSSQGEPLKHVQEAMKEKNSMIGKALGGGGGRLTHKICGQLQNHCGNTIRSCSSEPDGMYKSK